MAHPVLWFEVLGKDADTLQQFYQRLFGWYIDANNPLKYGQVETGAARGIQGGVGQVYDPRTRPWSTFYVETPDINATLAEAEALGGKTLLPRQLVGGNTILAMFEDPEGNVIGLVEPTPAASDPVRDPSLSAAAGASSAQA